MPFNQPFPGKTKWRKQKKKKKKKKKAGTPPPQPHEAAIVAGRGAAHGAQLQRLAGEELGLQELDLRAIPYKRTGDTGAGRLGDGGICLESISHKLSQGAFRGDSHKAPFAMNLRCIKRGNLAVSLVPPVSLLVGFPEYLAQKRSAFELRGYVWSDSP